jgi:UDP-N-acetylglucosamine 2-epimerase (non-hydrolysing)
VVDACIRNLRIARKKSTILSQMDLEGDILTLTLHRAENVDDLERLNNIVDAILALKNLTIIFPVHPRTVKTLKKFGLYSRLEEAAHIQMIKPIGYLDFLILLSNSKLVMTDSGGIQEEAITLNVPCLTLRYNTERPETVKAGGNLLVGADKEKISQNLSRILEDSEFYRRMEEAPNPYGDGKASEKIVRAILDTYNRGKLNIEPPEEISGVQSKKLLTIDEKVTVAEFEEQNPEFTVNIVFDGAVGQFPHPGLILDGKKIIVSYTRADF